MSYLDLQVLLALPVFILILFSFAGSDNEAVFRSISDFVNKTFGSAIKQLNTANQDLLQAQIQLQEAVTCLKQVANNSSQVKSKIDSILSTPFLPNIKIQVPPALPIDSELLK